MTALAPAYPHADGMSCSVVDDEVTIGTGVWGTAGRPQPSHEPSGCLYDPHEAVRSTVLVPQVWKYRLDIGLGYRRDTQNVW